MDLSAVKEDYNTMVTNEIDCRVTEMNCIYQWDFEHYYMAILTGWPGVDGIQRGHPAEKYWLSSVEVGFLIFVENKMESIEYRVNMGSRID